jgi:seryl-tRNA synthetase
MLDLTFIRENPAIVGQAIKNKHVDLDIDQLLALDLNVRAMKQQVEATRTEQNLLSKQMAKKVAPEERASLQLRGRELAETLKTLEPQLREVEEKLQQLLLLVPNIPSPDEPVGESEKENVELRTHGTLPSFDFTVRDHIQLLEMHNWADFQYASKVAGPRSYLLKGQAVYLEMACWRMGLDWLTQRGFTPMTVPALAREEAFTGTGHLPLGKEDIYYLPKDDMYLSGTGEVALNYLHSGEILSEEDLPRLYAGFSSCFRREAGSAGRDVRGLVRVHQFFKVEQYVLCQNNREESARYFNKLLENAESLVQALELPYRIIRTCTGDMGLGKVRMWDIECWIPSLNKYRETHSVSELYDWQARRAKLRYRDSEGRVRFCYTLNNTAIATPRILVPFLENHQQADGTIYIPPALRPYLGGLESLG